MKLQTLKPRDHNEIIVINQGLLCPIFSLLRDHNETIIINEGLERPFYLSFLGFTLDFF